MRRTRSRRRSPGPGQKSRKSKASWTKFDLSLMVSIEMNLMNITCRLLAVKSAMAGNLIIASFAHKRMRAFDGKT